MGLFDMFGMTRAQRMKKCELDMLDSHTAECLEEATAEVNRLAALVREALDDEDQFVRLRPLHVELEAAIERYGYFAEARGKFNART